MDIKDVENLAKLARIELSEDEKKDLLHDMDNILGYVKQIEEMKIEDVGQEQGVHNIWREDIIEQRDFSSEIIAKQFPDAHDGFLKVKKIL
ncbi:MAG: Asp-tRNA(Asn)/Glu-tRNA(Gln) amidotransferase subunit GatC [Candidatus Paceibacterota bacterium]